MQPPLHPIAVAFPLRGEWVAANTPADRVPSHGTDQLGQRYAFDFIRIDRSRSGWKFHRAPLLRALIMGAALEDCYGWSAPILAPFAGTVTAAHDGVPDRDPVHFARDLALVLKNAFTFNPHAGATALRTILGNYVILQKEGEEVYAFFAHARCGSIQVTAGQQVGPRAAVGAGGPHGQLNCTASALSPHGRARYPDGEGSALLLQGV